MIGYYIKFEHKSKGGNTQRALPRIKQEIIDFRDNNVKKVETVPTYILEKHKILLKPF